MDPLISTIQRCNLPIKLDDNTEGYGNCFPNAIVQQCQRPEIRTWLQNSKPQAIVNHQSTLRKKITNFALKSIHTTIMSLRSDYDQILKLDNGKSWIEYWNEMAKEGIWVDYLFAQVCAWYMELDMLILTTSSTPKNPFIFISGNFHNLPAPLSGPPLLLGNYTNIHYQSLLPIDSYMNAGQRSQPESVISMIEKKKEICSQKEDHQEEIKKVDVEEIDLEEVDDYLDTLNMSVKGKTIEDEDGCISEEKNGRKIPENTKQRYLTIFEFSNDGTVISFPITEEQRIICHNCKKKYKNIIKHLQNTPECRMKINIDEMKRKWIEFRKPEFLLKKRLWYIKKKRVEDYNKAKDDQNKWQRKHRIADSEENPEK